MFLSTRKGAWILNRLHDQGLPADIVIGRRVFSMIPKSWIEGKVEQQVNQRIDHEKYGLKPKHGLFAGHPTVNDDLPNRIANGRVKIKCDVKRFTKHGVEFEDGTHEEIDCVILGTGYTFSFPMVDPKVVTVDRNQVSLYKNVFPPDLKHPTIAIIGLAQPLGSTIPIAEMQCRWASRVLKGVTDLPPKQKMWDYINKYKSDMAQQYYASQRHTIQVDYIPYMDEVASEFGVKPKFCKLFLQSPTLALRCFFGPCYSYQYRLMGPGKWDGAKEAIETAWDRILAPFDTRRVPMEKKSGSSVGFCLKSLVVIGVAVGVVFALK